MTSKLTRDIIQSEIADFFAGVVEIHTELGGPNTVEEAQNQLTERVLACVPEVDGEPTDDERIMAIEGIHNCERCGDEGWIVGEMGITRCSYSQAGNSPVQPYCRPAQNSVAPEQSPIDHGYRTDCECTGCKATARICAELAGWIPVSERMPETDGNYWGWWSESKRQGPVWFIKSELQAQFQSHEITHWMPLPAAPQEVK